MVQTKRARYWDRVQSDDRPQESRSPLTHKLNESEKNRVPLPAADSSAVIPTSLTNTRPAELCSLIRLTDIYVNKDSLIKRKTKKHHPQG